MKWKPIVFLMLSIVLITIGTILTPILAPNTTYSQTEALLLFKQNGFNQSFNPLFRVPFIMILTGIVLGGFALANVGDGKAVAGTIVSVLSKLIGFVIISAIAAYVIIGVLFMIYG